VSDPLTNELTLSNLIFGVGFGVRVGVGVGVGVAVSLRRVNEPAWYGETALCIIRTFHDVSQLATIKISYKIIILNFTE
jgi:hypothetical protein